MEALCASYHDAAVVGAAGDDVVVVGAELDVQDGPRVAAHGGVAHVDPARLHARTERGRKLGQLGMSGKKFGRRGTSGAPFCPPAAINSI